MVRTMRRLPAKRSVPSASKTPHRRVKGSASPTHSGPKFTAKAAAFIRKHWPERGRAERIARAEKAWREAVEIASTSKKIDDGTWKWIAQSRELEDI
jgi:hypothetical protein